MLKIATKLREKRLIQEKPQNIPFSPHKKKTIKPRQKYNNGVYKFKDQIIIAFKGTATERGLAKDLRIADGGSYIWMVINLAVEAAKEHKADYVCGHSLGGLLAEFACARLGIKCAKFNGPGPWAANRETNLASGDKYTGVPFEINLTNGDPVSMMGCMGGA